MQEAEDVGKNTHPSSADESAKGEHSAIASTGRLHLRVLDDTENEGYTGIGDELRAIRERRNESIKDIADALRIRAVLIEALENGNFDELPGDIYVTGFLKTYATHLDQNPDDVIARFRMERDEVSVDPVYNFPKPVKEDSSPRGVLLLVALILAVGIYGTWYWTKQTDKVDLSQTPAVPERFAALPETWNQDATSETATSVDTPEKVSKAPQEDSNDTPSISEADVAPEDLSAPVRETVELASDSVTATEVENAPANDSNSDGDVDVAFAAQQPASSLITPRAEKPVVLGNLTLNATGSVWVQIKNENGQTRYSGILRAGDQYSVDGEENLFLMTGDAGALEITDGSNNLGALGAIGEAKTHVPLTLSDVRDIMGLQ